MKFLSILVAASLALTPAFANAGSSGDSTESADNIRPISGPLAVQPAEGAIPVGAYAAGAGLAAAILICVIVCDSDSNNDSSIDTAVDTNNGTN